MSFITVISSKGGSGKSTIVMGLGLWASKLRPNQNVLLIDGDLVVNTIQFKMCRKPKATLADVLRGISPLEDALHQCDLVNPDTGEAIYPNLGILPAAKRRRGQKQRESFLPPMHGGRYASVMQIARQLDDMKDELQKIFSLVFVDTPATRGMEHMFLAGLGDGIIYVIDPTDESIEATLTTASDLERMLGAQTIGVVINRLSSKHKKQEWVKKASEIGPVLGVVPKDDLVDDTFARNIPVVAENENCPASQALKEITLRLLETKIKPSEKIAPRLESIFWGLAESLIKSNKNQEVSERPGFLGIRAKAHRV